MIVALLSASACGEPGANPHARLGVSGMIRVDGSSTVYPITEAVAEEFQRDHPEARVTVAISGTTGGFRKFCRGEADISDASRPIKSSELEACRDNGVDPMEVIVGFDGISVVANPANDFVDCLTTAELRRIWRPGSSVTTWRDVRIEWPAERIILYGPGADSGTFDYFTDAVVGEEDASRPDFTASEDDNVLVHGVAGDRYALGYFGYAYYVENADRLKLLAIDDGAGCIKPSYTTIQTRQYSPLTRPLFIYIDQDALHRAEVKSFADFYLSFAMKFLPQVGYVPLTEDRYRLRLDEIDWRSIQ
jgi:phosphate transport system substrate-binding protein